MITKLYECMICGGLHPWDWSADCRDNANRYGSERDYAERNKLTAAQEHDVLVYSWEARLEADEAGL